MSIEIRADDHRSLVEYAAVSIAFEVRHVLTVETARSRSSPLQSRPVAAPYVKDYDAALGNHPREWSRCFDVRRALFLVALRDQRRVGGAVLIVAPDDVRRLGGSSDSALLWDLRVAPEFRRQGVGRCLLNAVESLARALHIDGICVETQDVNVGACCLYHSAGYELTEITSAAYPDLPHETRLIWTKSFHLRSSRHPANER